MKKTLGLVGLLALGSMEANAQDSAIEQDTRYLNLSEAEVQAEVLKRAQKFRYEDFKRLEGNEDFDGVIIASSTCHHLTDGRNRRNEIIFLRLMDRFNGAKSFNGDPLVFGYFDICGRSGYDLLGFDGLSFGMYLDGKQVDILHGYAYSDNLINKWYDFLSTGWIPTNLTKPNGEFAWRFQGTFQERQVSFRP